MRKRCTLIIVALFMSGTLIAQDQRADPQKTENIRKLLQLLGAEKVQQTMADQFVEAMKPLFASMPQDDPKTRAMLTRLSDLVIEEFRKIDFMTITVELYDKYFTGEEIEGLIRFYQTPLGSKASAVLPAITQESFTRGKQQGELATARAIVRLTSEYPELRRGMPSVTR